MKAIEKLFTKAETALLKKRQAGDKDASLVKDNQISQTKVGAMAGFGAMVINIGLLPTLAVYKANNPEILAALIELTGKKFDDVKNENENQSLKRLNVEKFINASVALKMMARTFNITEENGDEL